MKRNSLPLKTLAVFISLILSLPNSAFGLRQAGVEESRARTEILQALNQPSLAAGAEERLEIDMTPTILGAGERDGLYLFHKISGNPTQAQWRRVKVALSSTFQNWSDWQDRYFSYWAENLDQHVPDAYQDSIRLAFSVVREETRGTPGIPYWFLQIEYRDQNTDGWETEIKPAVTVKGVSRKRGNHLFGQEKGVGLTYIWSHSDLLIVEGSDSERRRIRWGRGPMTRLEPKRQLGTEIIARIPIGPVSFIDNAVSKLRKNMRALVIQGRPRTMSADDAILAARRFLAGNRDVGIEDAALPGLTLWFSERFPGNVDRLPDSIREIARRSSPPGVVSIKESDGRMNISASISAGTEEGRQRKQKKTELVPLEDLLKPIQRIDPKKADPKKEITARFFDGREGPFVQIPPQGVSVSWHALIGTRAIGGLRLFAGKGDPGWFLRVYRKVIDSGDANEIFVYLHRKESPEKSEPVGILSSGRASKSIQRDGIALELIKEGWGILIRPAGPDPVYLTDNLLLKASPAPAPQQTGGVQAGAEEPIVQLYAGAGNEVSSTEWLYRRTFQGVRVGEPEVLPTEGSLPLYSDSELGEIRIIATDSGMRIQAVLRPSRWSGERVEWFLKKPPSGQVSGFRLQWKGKTLPFYALTEPDESLRIYSAEVLPETLLELLEPFLRVVTEVGFYPTEVLLNYLADANPVARHWSVISLNERKTSLTPETVAALVKKADTRTNPSEREPDSRIRSWIIALLGKQASISPEDQWNLAARILQEERDDDRYHSVKTAAVRTMRALLKKDPKFFRWLLPALDVFSKRADRAQMPHSVDGVFLAMYQEESKRIILRYLEGLRHAKEPEGIVLIGEDTIRERALITLMEEAGRRLPVEVRERVYVYPAPIGGVSFAMDQIFAPGRRFGFKSAPPLHAEESGFPELSAEALGLPGLPSATSVVWYAKLAEFDQLGWTVDRDQVIFLDESDESLVNGIAHLFRQLGYAVGEPQLEELRNLAELSSFFDDFFDVGPYQAGMEDTGPAERRLAVFDQLRELTDGFRSVAAPDSKSVVVIGSDVARRLGFQVLAGLESRVVIDRGDLSDTLSRLVQRGEVAYFYGEANRGKALQELAQRAGLEGISVVIRDPAAHSSDRFALWRMLSDLNVPAEAIAAGLGPLMAGLEALAEAA